MDPACAVCKGACCETMLLDLRKVMSPDVLRWFELHGEQESNGTRLNCACSKLKNGKCSIWDDRPQVCKMYEVGSQACRNAVRTRRAEYKAEEILRIIDAEELRS